MNNMYITKKFLGSNTGGGFKGFYGDLLYGSGFGPRNQNVYILKGGPGTGKSTFIKKVATMLETSGCDIELLLCSGDVKSLDGVISKTGGITVVDGTNPHCLEPVCPGVHENIVNLGAFWNREVLGKYSDSIEMLSEKKSNMYKKAYHYLAAAREIIKERTGILNKCVDRRKMRLYSDALSEELIPKKDDSEGFGLRRRAFATAVTSEGVFGEIPGARDGELHGYKIYCIRSELGISCESILGTVAENAVNSGYDVDLYYCGFDSEKLEHIVIPELSTAIVTSNEYHIYEKQNTEQEILPEGFLRSSVKISTERCMDYDIGYAKIRFDELIERVFRALQKASEYHRSMEDYYVEAMDFSSLNDFADYILCDMAKLIQENVLGKM